MAHKPGKILFVIIKKKKVNVNKSLGFCLVLYCSFVCIPIKFSINEEIFKNSLLISMWLNRLSHTLLIGINFAQYFGKNLF